MCRYNKNFEDGQIKGWGKLLHKLTLAMNFLGTFRN